MIRTPEGTMRNLTTTARHLALIATLAAFAALGTGCGDITSTTGEMGRVNYSLYTTYLTQQADLAQVGILTGHPQRINTDLTDLGENVADEDGEEITHQVTPSDGVTIEAFEDGDDEIADFSVTVTDPGVYTFESYLNGQLFDYIELTFETPETLELLTRVREPYSEDWQTLNPGQGTVEEGSQVAFLPIPINAEGARIAGDFDVQLAADPSWAVAPAYNIWGIYEQNIAGSASPVSIYFIEPGDITVTLTDEVNDVGSSWVFDVLPVDMS
jgi:hypothetical protein